MNIVKKIFRSGLALLAIISDWFLITIGIFICVKALLAVDLQVAKYLLAAMGIGLSGCGILYRYKRLRR